MSRLKKSLQKSGVSGGGPTDGDSSMNVEMDEFEGGKRRKRASKRRSNSARIKTKRRSNTRSKTRKKTRSKTRGKRTRNSRKSTRRYSEIDYFTKDYHEKRIEMIKKHIRIQQKILELRQLTNPQPRYSSYNTYRVSSFTDDNNEIEDHGYCTARNENSCKKSKDCDWNPSMDENGLCKLKKTYKPDYGFSPYSPHNYYRNSKTHDLGYGPKGFGYYSKEYTNMFKLPFDENGNALPAPPAGL